MSWIGISAGVEDKQAVRAGTAPSVTFAVPSAAMGQHRQLVLRFFELSVQKL